MQDNLAGLVKYLNALQERAPLMDLMEAVRRLRVRCEDVAGYIRFSERGYARNLICSGPWFNMLVLCWKNGQRSPIHDHKGSSCAVRVLRGVATETVFDYAPNGHVWAVSSRQHQPDSVVGSQDTDLHQISNLQDQNKDLVTLHVYSPPLMWMGTYSLLDSSRGQEPMFVEFCDAAGI